MKNVFNHPVTIGSSAEQHISEWNPVYHNCNFSKSELSVEEFLSSPWAHLIANGQETYFLSDINGYRPLLPKQAQVAKKIRQLDLAAAKTRNQYTH